MIDVDSIKHRGLKSYVTKGTTGRLPKDLVNRIAVRLEILDALLQISDIPSAYRAHQLKGQRRGTWSIWVSGPWRLTFKFRQETVFDLDLEQYH